jgi:glycosyltransferase involved in cell wall biosynthesis
MMCATPHVSIIVPVYNRRDMLRRALMSIQQQTFADFEVVVVDDGSDDSPEKVVEELRDPRFRSIRQERSGASSARNHGIRITAAPFVAFLDSDDEWLPEKLERQIAALERTDLVHAGAITCGVVEQLPDGTVRNWLPSRRGRLLCDLLEQRRLGIGPPYLLCKRAVFDQGLRFDPDLPARQDFDFAAQLLQNYELEIVPQALLRVHHHRSERVYSADRSIAASTRLAIKYADLFDRHPLAKRKFHLRLTWTLIATGRWQDARTESRRALALGFSVLPMLWILLCASQANGSPRRLQLLFLRVLIRLTFGRWHS